MIPENPLPDNIDDNADDQIVCPHCLYLNEPQAAFCTQCGAPIGMVANVDPMQQIYSEGFGFRSAADSPPKRIILIGVWLVMLPIAGSALNQIRLGVFYMIPFLLISAAILYRVTHNYVVKSRAARKP